MMVELFGGIEGGGTKFVCAIGGGPDDILAETRFPTTTPVETLGKAIAFFGEQQGVHGPLTAAVLKVWRRDRRWKKDGASEAKPCHQTIQPGS